jgi:2,3-bisphosphoglycerate-independent phosphoglycerate mutase
MTIGAGKVIDTDLVRISKAIRDNQLGCNPAFMELFEHVKKNNSVLHIKGLLSPGGVHSHSEHLYAIIKTAKESGIEKIAIHAFTDGRDTAPQSAAQYLEELEDVIEKIGIGYIATVSGRFYAMDRDNNWDRLAKAEAAIFECKGQVCQAKKPSVFMKELYVQGIMDEHLEPVVFLDDEGNGYPVSDNDGILFFNFRADRARMLSAKILEKKEAKNLSFVTLTEYDKNFGCLVAFSSIEIETTLANEIAKAGLTAAHIAETEKYAHATYFLNGGTERPHAGEEHILVESRKDIQTHDQAPEMKAKEIADKVLEQIEKGTDFIFINFANADMVGHTANVPALKIAVETIDRELKRVVEAVQAKGGVVFITSDHGNAELNIEPSTGERHTAHTNNLVPAIITKAGLTMNNGSLADVTPTILALMGLEQPKSMTGKNLIS